MPWNEIAVQVLRFLLLLLGVLATIQHLSQWAREARRWQADAELAGAVISANS